MTIPQQTTKQHKEKKTKINNNKKIINSNLKTPYKCHQKQIQNRQQTHNNKKN